MQNFHNLENSSLKAFYFAAQELHFTKAAVRAGLTQSGVSQHVDKLETELQVELFFREKRKLSLTPAGLKLLQFVQNQLLAVNALVENIQADGQQVQGLVRYAMPDSCLFSPHLQQFISRRNKEFQQIQLHIQICPSEVVVEKLLNHEIDFGFITQNIFHKQMQLKKFVTEEYVLVSHERKLTIDKAEIENLNFIDYPEVEVLYNRWCQAEFKTNKFPRWSDLKKTGTISSLRGAIKMVESGLGFGLFQRHCVESELKAKTLFAVGHSGPAAKNPIFIATLKNKQHSQRVQMALDAFDQMAK